MRCCGKDEALSVARINFIPLCLRPWNQHQTVNARRSVVVVHRQQRWSSIKAASGQRLVISEKPGLQNIGTVSHSVSKY